MHLRKKLVVATAVTASLALGGAAYAYWSTSTASNGSGNGATASTVGQVTASGVLVDATGDNPATTPITPEGKARLKVTFSNSNAFAVKVPIGPGALSAVADVDIDPDTAESQHITADGEGGLKVPDCGVHVENNNADGATISVPKQVGATAGVASVFLDVEWVNLDGSDPAHSPAANQDDCLGKDIKFTINPAG